MSKPVLYSLDMSPPCRTVLLTGAAIGLQYDVRNVDLLKGEHLSEDYLKMNPQHTIPTLNDNGFVMWDSHAIACYLVDKYAKDDTLYPKDLKKRAVVNQHLFFDAEVLFPSLKSICKPIVIGGQTDVPEAKVKAIEEGLKTLNDLLDGKKWLAGDSYTLADISCVTTVSTLTVFKQLTDYPNVQAWLKRCEDQLPGYAKMNVPGNNELHQAVRQKLSGSS